MLGGWLARLHRAGELTAIRVPTQDEEAVRDLCRARADLLDDRHRARKRLGAFLLRHGKVYRAGSPWTMTHDRWLSGLVFEQRAAAVTFAHYRAALAERDATLAAIEADLWPCAEVEPFGECVRRLGAYRGIARLGALTFASEVIDWRGLRRRWFCGARAGYGAAPQASRVLRTALLATRLRRALDPEPPRPPGRNQGQAQPAHPMRGHHKTSHPQPSTPPAQVGAIT